MRILIFGMDRASQDVTGDWDEAWGLAHDPDTLHRTRAFESHSEAIIRKHGPKHIDRLKLTAELMPLYTPWEWSETLGPKHEVIPHPTVSKRYESSIAYPFALAITWSATKIGLYGCSMAADSEYAYQRPNTHYLIGLAESRGIEVIVSPKSTLLESQWTAGIYGHPDNINDMAYKL